MKSYIRHWALCGLFISTLCTSNAQTHQFINIWGEAGCSTFRTSITNASTNLGPGGALGAGYELRAGKFSFTAGLGFALNNSSLLLLDETREIEGVIDSEGDVFTLNYNQADRKDSYTYGYLQIPIMAGMHFYRFYFLAGGKVNIHAFGTNKVTASLSTSGTYPQFIDPFTNMPEHSYFGDTPFKQTNKVKFTQDVALSAEIGWRLGMIAKGTGYDVPKSKIQYRIGIFCDYGLFDIHQKGNNDIISLPTGSDQANVNAIQLNDILSTGRASAAVKNLFAGIKFTVLFQLPKRGVCVICDD